MQTAVKHLWVRLFIALPFAALMTAPAYAARTAPLYTPAPIEVPAGKSMEEVKKAVRKALFDKGWHSRDIGPGHVEGKYTKTSRGQSHTAVVEVKFDTKTVRINYKSSDNLDYDASGPTIHKTYNGWAMNLERNIRGNLGAF